MSIEYLGNPQDGSGEIIVTDDDNPDRTETIPPGTKHEQDSAIEKFFAAHVGQTTGEVP